ncbi:GTP pyrophosphokinase [Vibrio vulnificus]|uniref:GTP pyrophosphokinase n=1 Tax=Vibrio vulnificus TaxID=672 RepID=UPI00324239C9
MGNEKSFFTPDERRELVKEYELKKSSFTQLCEEIKAVIDYFLQEHADIKVSSLSSRVKSVDSFLGKLDRKPYKSPFSEIDDFAGVRVVLYRASDIAKLELFLSKEFEVLEVDNKTEKLGIAEMGYGGTHVIIRLGENYRGIKQRKLSELRCEIQIRTVLQDAWSTMSHSLSYKTKELMPAKMQRDLNNLASLLEVADSGFERIIEDKKALNAKAKNEARMEGFLSMSITVERLEEYSLSKFPNLPVNEYWQEKLASDLKLINGFSLLKDIDDAVGRAKVAVSRYQEKRPDLFKSSTDFLTKSIGFVSGEFRDVHPFSDATLDVFSAYGDSLEQKRA